MDALERDDITHAIDMTLGFYGKKLDKVSTGFWLNAIRGKDLTEVKRALMDYSTIGKYAPKPVDILQLLDLNQAQRRSSIPPPEVVHNPAPPEVEAAWRWFIPMHASASKNLSGVLQYHTGDLDAATMERYLVIVNEQAKAHDMPDAIPQEFRLAEVWG
jgi:hypothetical protein